MVPFGEQVLYEREKPNRKLTTLEPRPEPGIWAGTGGLSGETIALTPTCARKARTVNIVEDRDKYDAELLSRVRGQTQRGIRTRRGRHRRRHIWRR